MSEGVLLTVIGFLSPVRCAADVLGTRSPCSIGDIQCEILFPTRAPGSLDGARSLRSPAGLEAALLKPLENSRSYHRSDPEMDEAWGMWRALLGPFVGRAALRIMVSNSYQPERVVDAVVRSFSPWHARLLDWLQIQTGQNLGWGLGNFEWDLVGIDVYASLRINFCSCSSLGNHVKYGQGTPMGNCEKGHTMGVRPLSPSGNTLWIARRNPLKSPTNFISRAMRGMHWVADGIERC